MILIASSVSLLVIVAGMFLLAKTQKDNLSNLFKYVSYFVIIVGFLNLFYGGIHFIMKQCSRHYAAEMKHYKKYDKHDKMMMYQQMHCADGMMDPGKCGMMGHGKCGMMDQGKCSMHQEKCMEMGNFTEPGNMQEKACCRGKIVVKKDSVIIKK